jgi:predicted Zn finger-like uncharacterized protein
MRHITHCPACETQFFVTDEQLNQHEGKVRCGQCLHIFNARQQIIETTSPASAEPHQFEEHQPVELQREPSEDLDNSSKPFVSDENQTIPVGLAEPFLIEPEPASQEYTPNDLDDFLDKTQFKKLRKPVNTWALFGVAVLLILVALAQAIYFLRNEIALYYPATKLYLTQLCQTIHCRIELPKKIELIVIDDSDIQEDAEHQGLIWLSSTLINQARFTQALPNLELTLTDVEDRPKLRRIISPAEYMPHDRDYQLGLTAHEEIRIRLPIDTQNEVLAGYRVMVTY